MRCSDVSECLPPLPFPIPLLILLIFSSASSGVWSLDPKYHYLILALLFAQAQEQLASFSLSFLAQQTVVELAISNKDS